MLVEVIQEMQPLPHLPSEQEGVPLLLEQLTGALRKPRPGEGLGAAVAAFTSLAKLLTQLTWSGGVRRNPLLTAPQLVQHLLVPFLLDSSKGNGQEQALAIAGLRAVLLETLPGQPSAREESALLACFQRGLLTHALSHLAEMGSTSQALKGPATELAENLVAALAARLGGLACQPTSAAAGGVLEAVQGQPPAVEAVLLPLLSACHAATASKPVAPGSHKAAALSSQVSWQLPCTH